MVGDWWLVAVGSGWQLAVGRRWRLAVGGWWQLAVGGGWWSAVGGPLGWSLWAVLNKKKSSSLRTPLVLDLLARRWWVVSPFLVFVPLSSHPHVPMPAQPPVARPLGDQRRFWTQICRHPHPHRGTHIRTDISGRQANSVDGTPAMSTRASGTGSLGGMCCVFASGALQRDRQPVVCIDALQQRGRTILERESCMGHGPLWSPVVPSKAGQRFSRDNNRTMS